jgi:hypothetical protein
MLSAAVFAPDNGNESSDQERNSSSDDQHGHANKKGGAKPKRRRKREIGLQGEGRQVKKPTVLRKLLRC